MGENMSEDNRASWRQESKLGFWGLLKEENKLWDREVVLGFDRLLFALYPRGLGDKSSRFRLVRLLLFGLLLWVRITEASIAFCSDHAVLSTSAPVRLSPPHEAL